ncbi:MAG: DsbE family thiol:disulfide interchange protein [Pseudomonadales bacterium]|jgi:cytochrome c biogenesis protein CcmG/thiol:disulfide interchange protein DsbE|uniref:DsbE family thiol:disulfide interchange protein n=1 Tax=Halopseudomonas TaxID=2901189 RepID=UPI000C4E248F|nr:MULTISPECIES: DsbE family thiol:disulfide interchange protein [Halopseudomonas]MAK74897.1 DsbE family thiol:disulfide interchange protein [Pseudomonadales bacterium]MEE2798167.1 DsbE family thiol:disulfide interchange protein [Pseudomonadota bacterium]HBT57708.1 DsbE family thiol:disulfide interchange protein [Pseudomonas sp.]MAP76512.1 DsbE family thiol:disulfide interchange protein [Pseudomonadales bacterium]MAS67566.1 DsbE family thiol:disulfide interchange protein [Pseudomonadales bacte|tara:strand:- start:4874 stop:5422 length:549 start_codon:yes stop_codon:yes gene_type:complete
MRRLLLIVPLLLFLVLAGFFLQSLMTKEEGVTELELPSPLLNKPFPTFDLPSVIDGEPRITQADLKGPALVNIWATWCVACRVEHPVLNRLAAEGVVIYGVNYKDTNADAIKWLKDFHNPYQLNISDADGRLGLDLGVYGAPETYLIDANGVIRHKFIGVIDDRVWDTDLGARYQALVEEAK